MATCDLCERPTVAKGLCSTHYAAARRREQGRAQKRGPEHHNWNPLAGYRAAHRRIERSRGPAAEYLCVDCGRPAREWSLMHDADIVSDDRGRRFSRDPGDYEPRCPFCHGRYDFPDETARPETLRRREGMDAELAERLDAAHRQTDEGRVIAIGDAHDTR